MTDFPATLRRAMAAMSVRRAALLLSYHPRSVSRWLAGSRTPHEAVQTQVIAQLNQHQQKGTK